MKIGIITSNRQPSDGGGFTFQTSIIDALSTVKTDHEFVIFDFSEYSNLTGKNGIPVVGMKSPHKKYRRYYDFRWWMKLVPVLLKKSLSRAAMRYPSFNKFIFLSPLAQALRTHQIDVAWFLSPEAEVVPCPSLITVWDLQHRLQPWFPEVSHTGYNWTARETHYQQILPRATRVFIGTTAGKEEIIHFYRLPPDNVKVIPLPAPKTIEKATEKQLISVREKYHITGEYFIYPAQFWPHKNHVNLLRAIVITKSKNPSSPNIVLTGSDKGNKLFIERISRNLGIDQYVYFLGFVPQSDLYCLYQDAIAMVFPTFFGPDNLPPLEAFASGCPVIASSVSGSQEQYGDAVVSFNPAKPEELADAMLMVHSNAALRDTLRKKGYERAAKLNPSDYVAQVCSTIDEIDPMLRCWEIGYRQPV